MTLAYAARVFKNATVLCAGVYLVIAALKNAKRTRTPMYLPVPEESEVDL